MSVEHESAENTNLSVNTIPLREFSPDDPLRVLSLGAGVQSSTVLLMSCRGVLPKLDLCIFADTGWEPAEVYEHLAWLEDESAKAEIPIYRVGDGHLKEDALASQVRGIHAEGSRGAALPYFVLSPDDKKGMIRRQCTGEYKITPIERFQREHILGLQKGERSPWKEPVIDQWFGISRDEIQRTRISDKTWKRFLYPLIGEPINRDFLPKPMSRGGCHKWLEANYRSRNVPRSACIGCPFHSNHEWRGLRDNSPEEWADAVAFDKAIRDTGGERGQVFLHADRVPLDEVKLDESKAQGNLFDNECAGICGV